MKTVDTDEHPRPDTTLEALAKLPATFRSPRSIALVIGTNVHGGRQVKEMARERGVQ